MVFIWFWKCVKYKHIVILSKKNKAKMLVNILLKRFVCSRINKRHELSIMLKYDTDNNCESRKTSESKEISLFLRLPHLGNISLQIEKEIRQHLIKNLSTKSQFRLTHDTHNIGKCFKFKDRQALLHNAVIVSELNCSCEQSYIGQTHRNLATRIQEHVPNEKQNQESDVAKHLVSNPNHKINFDSPEILGHSNNRRKLRIKETLLIQKIQSQINLHRASKPIYLLNT